MLVMRSDGVLVQPMMVSYPEVYVWSLEEEIRLATDLEIAVFVDPWFGLVLDLFLWTRILLLSRDFTWLYVGGRHKHVSVSRQWEEQYLQCICDADAFRKAPYKASGQSRFWKTFQHKQATRTLFIDAKLIAKARVYMARTFGLNQIWSEFISNVSHSSHAPLTYAFFPM